MKTIFAFLAVCLVAANAAAVQELPINYEGMVDNVVNEMINIGVETALELQHQYEEIVKDPMQQVDVALQSIEERKDENEDCVAAEEEHIVEVVEVMHDEMSVCGVVAAKTSAAIMNDVNKATQQLIFDGISVGKTFQRCRNHKNSVRKSLCYAKLSVDGTLYMINAKRSISTIKKSKNERVPAVFTDADACTHVAADKAILELDNVHATIDACVVRMKN